MKHARAVSPAFRCWAAGILLLAAVAAPQARGRTVFRLHPSLQAASTPVPSASGSAGAELYQTQCAVCHGENGQGRAPSFPSLVGNADHLRNDEIAAIILHGLRRMPAFPQTSEKNLAALVTFLRDQDAAFAGDGSRVASQEASPAYPDATGQSLYAANCAICHGDDRRGDGQVFPSLVGVGARWNESRFLELVRHGQGRMPAFSSHLSEEDFRHLAVFLGVPVRQD